MEEVSEPQTPPLEFSLPTSGDEVAWQENFMALVERGFS